MALVVVIGSLLAYQVGYAGRVYPGVKALGVDLGGRTPEEARVLLDARTKEYSQTKLALRLGDRGWQATPAELGLSVDVAETVRVSYLRGRSGGLVERVGGQISALGSGGQVEPAVALDEARASEVLSGIAKDTDRSPLNAGLVVAPDGKVEVRPSQTGLALDTTKALTATRNSVLGFSTAEINLPTREVPATLTEAELAKARDQATKIVSQPLTLTAGGRSWTLTPQDIAPLVVVGDEGGRAVVKLDEAGLKARLDQIAQEVKRPAVDATLKISDGEVEVVPGANGEDLDVASSQTMIATRLGETSTMPLVLKKTPGLQPEALSETKAKLEALLASSVTFQYDGKSWKMSADDLADALKIVPGAAGSPPSVQLDEAALTTFVKGVAKQVDREPQDARFRYQGGKVSVVSESVDGLAVDVPATVAKAGAALASAGPTVALQVKVTKAEVTSAAAGEIVVRDVIMDASTPYAGSISAKVHNIQLAASRLNGTVVPPGAIFSFNKALGPATLASGFQLGYGIALDSNGQMETVPSEAGGICQVASTLFHTVFWSGYQVVERNWHMYWIPKYGQPPRGLKGLDATVDDAYGVDFKFKNNSENWIVIEADASGGVLKFVLRGVKPTWKVTVGQPKVTNVVPANREMVYENDPSMAPGQSLMVEAAEDGFDVSIDRTVSEGDQIIDQWTAKAHYRPSRNVTLVGGTPTPTPAPSKTPAASTPAATPAAGTATPAPSGTPQPTKAPAGTPTPTKAPAAPTKAATPTKAP